MADLQRMKTVPNPHVGRDNGNARSSSSGKRVGTMKKQQSMAMLIGVTRRRRSSSAAQHKRLKIPSQPSFKNIKDTKSVPLLAPMEQESSPQYHEEHSHKNNDEKRVQKSSQEKDRSPSDGGSSHATSNSMCDFENDLKAVKSEIFGSYLNLLLLLVPFGFISFYAKWNDTLVFFLNFFAMIPLASILGDATECLAEHLGETVGGLLNATFGNAVEIVVMIFALVKAKSYSDNDNESGKDALLLVVQTSLIGSIFSNSLLVLGCAFVANGIRYPLGHFDITMVSASVSLLMIASFVMILPAHYANSEHESDELMVSRAAAIVLIVMYSFSLVFVLHTHRDIGNNKLSMDAMESYQNMDMMQENGHNGHNDQSSRHFTKQHAEATLPQFQKIKSANSGTSQV